MTKITFTEKQKQDIIHVLNENYGSGRVNLFVTRGIDSLLEKWHDTASDIGKNYCCCPECAGPWQDTRDAIEDIVDVVPEDIQLLIREKLEKDDEIVRSKLTPADILQEKKDSNDINQSLYYESWKETLSRCPRERNWWWWGHFMEAKCPITAHMVRTGRAFVPSDKQSKE